MDLNPRTSVGEANWELAGEMEVGERDLQVLLRLTGRATEQPKGLELSAFVRSLWGDFL